MSKPVMNVALVCGPDSDMETQAIRAALECFQARVFTYWIGRPNDLISVLSGEDIYHGTDMIILSFHGDEGKLLMPELGEDVYEEGEPRALSARMKLCVMQVWMEKSCWATDARWATRHWPKLFWIAAAISTSGLMTTLTETPP